jgi:hypothetical protein
MAGGLVLLIPATVQKKGHRWSDGLEHWSTVISSLRSFEQMANQVGNASALSICTLLQVLAQAPVECGCYGGRLPREEACGV